MFKVTVPWIRQERSLISSPDKLLELVDQDIAAVTYWNPREQVASIRDINSGHSSALLLN